MNRTLFYDGWTIRENGGEAVPVSLPDDATLRQKRGPEVKSGSAGAFFPGGVYEYEKQFVAPECWAEQEVLLEFEGVYPSACVSLNGKEIGRCAYGYSQFRVPLRNLHIGEKNVLRVLADNSAIPNSRWYAGAGIYRPVWLLTGSKTHIEPGGVRVTTLSYDPAEIRVETVHTGECGILVEIFQGAKKIAESRGADVRLLVPDAKLWSDEHPSLYECRVTLERDGTVLDAETVRFGIRKLEWSPEKGLQVNGKSVKLRGGCIHSDNGILGAKSFAASEWRRIRKLKEWGFNAIRSSHNPLCRAALDACDVLGMYVMDETWDMWTQSKTPGDYAKSFPDNYGRDLASLVEKDYNHPSVILYSIGNELTEPAQAEGIALAERLCKELKALDESRPITAGINLTILLMASMGVNLTAAAGSDDAPRAPEAEHMDSTAFNQMVSEQGKKMTMAAATEGADRVSSPVLDLLDIQGYNYAVSRYEQEGVIHPKRVVVGSETYPQDLASTWPVVEKYPYLIGDFMWTAWDYLGEAGIGSWTYDPDDVGFQKACPWLLADSGALDILGNDNAEAGMAAVVWGARKTPYIAVRPVNHPDVEPKMAMWRGSNAIPSWSWDGCEGNPAYVEVYSTGSAVELFLNGKSIGKENLCDYKAAFHTNYVPGELKAISMDENGTPIAESVLRSAEGKTSIHVQMETGHDPLDGIFYVNILLVGENGVVESNRDTLLSISVEDGELLGFGSAKPKTTDSYLEGQYHSYYGRSQAVIRAAGNEVNVRVSGDGLDTVNQRLISTGG